MYFYPKNNTPGCTQEACDFRDNLNRLAVKALVIGVSRDSIASHLKEVLGHYGAWSQKNMYGKPVTGTIRTTVLIGKDGKIKRVWNNVKVKGHVDEVLSNLKF